MISTEQVWKDFSDRLLGFIQKRVKNPEAARDLLQDVFVKIHLHLPELKDADKLTSWVYQVTRNSILDYYRKQRPATTVPEEWLPDEEQQPQPVDFSTCLLPFVNELPAHAREAMLQTELGSISQKDFAAQHNLSYTAAKSRVQRARKQLHQLFNQCCRVETDKYGNVLEHDCKTNCGCR